MAARNRFVVLAIPTVLDNLNPGPCACRMMLCFMYPSPCSPVVSSLISVNRGGKQRSVCRNLPGNISELAVIIFEDAFHYISFLRPAPPSSMPGSIGFTPQITNDLRTGPFPEAGTDRTRVSLPATRIDLGEGWGVRRIARGHSGRVLHRSGKVPTLLVMFTPPPNLRYESQAR